jgi:hypothetical protein
MDCLIWLASLEPGTIFLDGELKLNLFAKAAFDDIISLPFCEDTAELSNEVYILSPLKAGIFFY